jgi:hypothetical protein
MCLSSKVPNDFSGLLPIKSALLNLARFEMTLHGEAHDTDLSSDLCNRFPRAAGAIAHPNRKSDHRLSAIWPEGFGGDDFIRPCGPLFAAGFLRHKRWCRRDRHSPHRSSKR